MRVVCGGCRRRQRRCWDGAGAWVPSTGVLGAQSEQRARERGKRRMGPGGRRDGAGKRHTLWTEGRERRERGEGTGGGYGEEGPGVGDEKTKRDRAMKEYGSGRGGEKRRAGIGKQKIDTAWIDCRKLSATTQATSVTLLVRCTTQHRVTLPPPTCHASRSHAQPPPSGRRAADAGCRGRTSISSEWRRTQLGLSPHSDAKLNLPRSLPTAATAQI